MVSNVIKISKIFYINLSQALVVVCVNLLSNGYLSIRLL